MKQLVAFIFLAFIAIQSPVVADDLVYPCTSPADCEAIQDSVCSVPDQACVCPGGRVMTADMTKCLKVSGGYGSSCEDTMQCSVRMLTGSTCYFDPLTSLSTCRCNQGYHYLHGRCWKSVGLNGTCTTSDQCFGNSNFESLSCDTSGVCACSEGFYLHADQTYCRREGTEPGDECYFDFDCKFEGAFCNIAKKCEAVTKESMVRRRLGRQDAFSVSYGEVSDDEDSLPWNPLDAYIPNKNCSTNADCTATYANSECTPGNTCWCTAGYYYNVGGARCAKELGETCTSVTDCNHIVNGTCRIPETETQGICGCNVYSTPGANNQRCNRLTPELGFNCQNQKEACQNFGPECLCVPEDVFVQCHCSAASHFEPDTQTCWLNKGVGESCMDNKDCLTASGEKGVDCVDGTCKCISGFHETAKDCRKDGLLFGDACIDDVDCFFSFSKCVDKACVCNAGYYAQNDTNGDIECITGIGGTCTGVQDCAHVEHAVCNTTTTKCECDATQMNSFVPSALHDKCLKVAANYADECEEHDQCQAMFGDHILCTDQVCVCREDFHFRDASCWPVTLLNERCNITSQCYVPSESERTECRNGFCECKFDFPTNEGKTDCTSGGDVIHQKIGLFTSLLLVTYLLVSSTLSRP